ncbi:MAG TPA: ATP-binding protein [Bacillota bacterium]|nr:ATP-binding protein [Bacillota bacterium]HPM63527.1 ATP-binding protein [Bacillota bacterium]
MRQGDQTITNLIDYFIAKGKEGEWWDFKQEWHVNMPDLIKDIVCFANTVHDKDGYLIFGVSDDLKLTGMQQTRKKQADIIDALSNLKFAGDNAPKIEVKTVKYEGTELDVLKIFDTNKTPVFLKKTYGNMKQGCIYTRNGDKNTPDNGNAEIVEIEYLWRKRLGLMKPQFEYIIDRLQNKLEWNEYGEYYYNIYKTEYSLRKFDLDEDLNRDKDEFYAYSQTNEAISYSGLNIMAYNTVLASYDIANLDSGRLSIPVPEWGTLKLGEKNLKNIVYKFYIKGSDLYNILDFMYNPGNIDEHQAYCNFMKVILLYHSEEERKAFEGYIVTNPKRFSSLFNASKEFEHIFLKDEQKTIEYKRRLRTGIVLNTLLKEWRRLDR